MGTKPLVSTHNLEIAYPIVIPSPNNMGMEPLLTSTHSIELAALIDTMGSKSILAPTLEGMRTIVELSLTTHSATPAHPTTSLLTGVKPYSASTHCIQHSLSNLPGSKPFLASTQLIYLAYLRGTKPLVSTHNSEITYLIVNSSPMDMEPLLTSIRYVTGGLTVVGGCLWLSVPPSLSNPDLSALPAAASMSAEGEGTVATGGLTVVGGCLWVSFPPSFSNVPDLSAPLPEVAPMPMGLKPSLESTHLLYISLALLGPKLLVSTYGAESCYLSYLSPTTLPHEMGSKSFLTSTHSNEQSVLTSRDPKPFMASIPEGVRGSCL